MSEILHRRITLLAEITSRFRREEMRALHREGVKIEEIADIFAVSVSQVEALLAAHTHGPSE